MAHHTVLLFLCCERGIGISCKVIFSCSLFLVPGSNTFKKKTKRHIQQNNKLTKTDNPNVGEDVEQAELSYIAGGNIKWDNQFAPRFLYKENKKIYICIFVAVLFIIITNWKQPR
jgi:hypothetical protein